MVVLAFAIPTLIGSICSLIAASFIFVCYFLFPFKAHFRHVLILNLATADLINALNNSISGIYYLSTGSLSAGPACTANGFIGQLSVQGTDFSILLIAIVTVIVLKSPRKIPDSSVRSQIFLSLAVWTVPLITSFTALGLNAYGPVSGNWCWIEADRPVLRYALTHGWRMGIILTTIALYAYLFYYFRQVFMAGQPPSTTSIKSNDTEHIMTAMANPQQYTGSAHLPRPTTEESQLTSDEMGPFELAGDAVPRRVRAISDGKPVPVQADHRTLSELTGEFTVNELEGDLVIMNGDSKPPPSYEEVQESESRDILAAAWVTNFASYQGRVPQPPRRFSEPSDLHPKALDRPNTGDISTAQPKQATDFATMNKVRNKKIQRALLLNAYPIAYVLLWLPGIINRFVELSTGKSSFALQVIQSSTQFVGVANAITYGFNERVRRRISSHFSRRRRGPRLVV